MATRVRRYGALKPTVGFALLLDQLRLAARYRNQLVELHNWFIIAKQAGADVEHLKKLRAEESCWLRAHAGLGFGTYQAIEADVQRAVRSKLRVPRAGSWRARRWAQMRAAGLNPTWFRAQFRHFDGTGRVGAMLQACSDATTDELIGDSSSPVQLHPGRARVRKDGRPRKDAPYGAYHLLRLRLLDAKRVQDGEQWVEVPVWIHRPIPEHARIVRALLVVNRVGGRWEYSAHLTVHVEPKARPVGAGSCAINFGWRRVKSGTRVAYAVGGDGEQIDLVLPRQLTEAMRHSEQLRALADDAANKYLGDARRRARARREALRDPEATHRELGHIQIDGEPLNREHWARRDRHLYQWERDEYAHVLRARRQLYHLWVLALASRFERVTIEDYNLSRLIERDQPVEIPEARHVRFLVAPGSLREEVEDVFGERATLLQPKKGRKRTMQCADCGETLLGDRAREIVLICPKCGAEWDQDANNATNQLTDVAAE